MCSNCKQKYIDMFAKHELQNFEETNKPLCPAEGKRASIAA
jgi:hypothetical protein